MSRRGTFLFLFLLYYVFTYVSRHQRCEAYVLLCVLLSLFPIYILTMNFFKTFVHMLEVCNICLALYL